MAVMKIRPYWEGQTSAPVRHGPVGVGETFEAGSPLVVDAGQLDEGGTDPTNIVGFAAIDVTGLTAGTEIPYHPAEGGAFLGTLRTGTSAYTLAAADIYAEVGLTVQSNGVWALDVAKTGATGRVRILGSVDPIGTSDARVIFKVSADQLLTFDS
jgi:hypothetical protein